MSLNNRRECINNNLKVINQLNSWKEGRIQSSVMMNRYEIMQQIGHGAYSIVFKAMDLLTMTSVAIKRINHTNPDISLVLNRQIRTLQALQHPNIIKLLGLYHDHTYTYLVFEYLPFDLITYYKDVKKNKYRNLNDEEITYIVLQMCNALGYMHQRGIMHRDIKPENVLIDPQTLNIKLIDFGFATPINPYAHNTQYMITRWYRPLEIVLNLPYDAKADIFALGALVLELYQGEQIFRSASNIDQLYWILEICGYPNGWTQAAIKMNQLGIHYNQKKYPQIYKMTRKIRPQAQNLIVGMLQTSPMARFSIIQILNHPYFSVYLQSKMKRNRNQSNTYTTTQNSMANHMKSRTNSTTTQNGYVHNKIHTNNNFYSDFQQKINNFVSPVNNRERYSHFTSPTNKQKTQFNLNLNRISMKNQSNSLIPSTQRSRGSSQDFNNMPSQRRLSSNFSQQIQMRTRTQKAAERYDSHQYGLSSRFKIKEPDQPKISMRTQGNEKMLDKNNIHTYSNSSLASSSNNKYANQKLNYVSKDNFLPEQSDQNKGLKFRTKSYQGINVVSLKRTNSKGLELTAGMNPQRNSQPVYNSNDQNPVKRKQPTFAKIRDKLIVDNKVNGKIKISLTQRNQFFPERRS